MRNLKAVLVTGGEGQLALCIKDLADQLADYIFIYADRNELDITNKEDVNSFFEKESIDYCINCAAYTAVDKAESDQEKAKNVNDVGVQYLAEACKKENIIFFHISTDFVFDGKLSSLYKETDKVNPLSVYGNTKLNGELAIKSVLEKHFIIRTSWLYSEYGNNFFKTMLKLGNEKDELNVVCDQIGTPTYAGDLAKVILKLIMENSTSFGTYHYSNEGVASWYDFAKAIFEFGEISIKVNPIRTELYPTPAKRPAFSVMDKSKIKSKLNIEIPYWKESLNVALSKLQ